jgi:hypothetical protein
MGDCEEDYCRGHRCPLVGENAKQAEQDETLQEKLLHEGPEAVAPEGFDEWDGAMRRMECLEPVGEDDGDGRDEKSHANDPRGTPGESRTQGGSGAGVER